MAHYHIRVEIADTGEILHDDRTDVFILVVENEKRDGTTKMIGEHLENRQRIAAANMYVNLIAQLHCCAEEILKSLHKAAPFTSDEKLQEYILKAAQEMMRQDAAAAVQEVLE